MTAISKLTEWYKSNCDGDWEHSYGVKIETLDNPGWQISIDLIDTDLEGVMYRDFSYGIGEDAHPDSNDWLMTRVVGSTFDAAGGPDKLDEMIGCFIKWANETQQNNSNAESRDA